MGRAPAIVADVLRSPGRPLDASTRTTMEARLGADLGGVRVHTDRAAVASADAVGARAYTVGHHVVIGHTPHDASTADTRRLLAHELTHVVQQAGAAAPAGLELAAPDGIHEDEAERVAAGAAGAVTASPARLAREVQVPDAPLSWDELLNLLSRERSILLTTPSESANPTWDPRGVGRGVGPDRTLGGTEVVAVIQVVDRDGRRVGPIGLGAHRLLQGGHAEEQALTGLARDLPADRDLTGGRMMVVVDQYPCPPGRRDCGGQLRDFARKRGLSLEVQVPMREDVRIPGKDVSPRTASRGAFRTDLAADPRTRVRLVTVDSVPGPAGTGGLKGGGTPPVGGASAALSGATHGAPPAVPTPAQKAQAISRQRLIAQLESETADSARFARRVRLYTGAFGALMQVLSSLQQMGEEQMMADAEQRAERLSEAAATALRDAETFTGDMSLLSATVVVGDAIKAGDVKELFELSSRLDAMAFSLDETAAPLRALADDLEPRSRVADVMAEVYRAAMYLPEGPAGTVPQSHAFTMYDLLTRFSSACRSASGSFGQAADLFGHYARFSRGLAGEANAAAWRGFAKAVVESQRQSEAAARQTPEATPGPPSHAPTAGVPPPQPRPVGLPSPEEQRGTICPSCHRPTGGRPKSLLSGLSLGSGEGGRMTEEDLRLIRTWLDEDKGTR